MQPGAPPRQMVAGRICAVSRWACSRLTAACGHMLVGSSSTGRAAPDWREGALARAQLAATGLAAASVGGAGTFDLPFTAIMRLELVTGAALEFATSGTVSSTSVATSSCLTCILDDQGCCPDVAPCGAAKASAVAPRLPEQASPLQVAPSQVQAAGSADDYFVETAPIGNKAIGTVYGADNCLAGRYLSRMELFGTKESSYVREGPDCLLASVVTCACRVALIYKQVCAACHHLHLPTPPLRHAGCSQICAVLFHSRCRGCTSIHCNGRHQGCCRATRVV